MNKKQPLIKLIISLFFIMAFSEIAFTQTPVNIQDAGNPEWIAQCGQQGGFGACENLADQHFRGNGVPKDLRMTAYYLLKACRYGNMDMCAYSATMAIEEVNDIPIYGEAVARMCEFGDPINCAYVWNGFKDPDTPHYNPAFVGRALETGCNNGSGYLCYLMGNWYDDYKPAPQVSSDANKASIGFQRTCMSDPSDPNLDRSKIKFSCYGAYKYLLGKDGAPTDLAQAKEAYLRTCEMADDVETCDIVVSSFFHGNNGMEQDHSATLSMAERSCELGSEFSCGLVAYSYILADNKPKAFSLYAKGCDTNPNKNDCTGAATTSFSLNGEQAQTTTEYALKACELGDGWACFVYGANTFYLTTDGNKEWFQKSCNYGLAEGCQEVARREEYEKNRNDPRYNCPRASCETRTWAEFLKDERAAAKERNNNQRSSFDFGVVTPIEATRNPFGNSERDRRNWNIYKENQRCSNPTAAGC